MYAYLQKIVWRYTRRYTQVLLLIFFISMAFCTNAVGGLAVEKIDVQQQSEYSLLKKDARNFIGTRHPIFSIPNFLYGETLLTPITPDETHEAMVDRLFRTYSDIFQIASNDFRIYTEHPQNRNITQIHLFQKYQNIPVFGGEVILTFNQRKELISYIGKYVPNIDINVQPRRTLVEASNIVAQDLQVEVVTQVPKLFILNKGLFNDTSDKSHLVWRIATHGWVYFVDAHTGEIVYKYDDGHYVLNREVYTGEGGTPTLPGTLVISEGDDISVFAYEDESRMAYTYSEYVYNYFYENFSLDSFDGGGTTMVSTVDYATSLGAQWCNYQKSSDLDDCPSTQQTMYYAGYSVLDIVAHEWAHGVNDYAVLDEGDGLYGLTMTSQSGALNESYSDIFGVLIEEAYGDGLDWTIGEDSPIGIIRSLEDPTTSATPQPDEWNEFDSSESSHYNSGIPNKAAYLIMREPTEGYETFRSIDVRGMGTDMAEQIFYYALRDELLVSATFEDNLSALLLTCLTLETTEIDAVDCESIYDAYTAIGVADGTITFVEANVTAGTTTGYGPLTVNFDATDSVSFGRNIMSYAWDFGDGSTGSGDTTSHIYDPGTYTATFTITDSDGQTDSTTVDITATNPLSANFTQTGDGAVAPATVSFDASTSTDATGTIIDYAWDFGDGSTTNSASTTASHTYASNGYYHVTLTITDDAGYSATYDHMAFIGTTNPTTISSGTTIYNDTWTAARSPYVISGTVTVASDATLTIEPGVVVKFYNLSSSLTINGTINAIGTSSSPIVLTSYKDDSNGGDTNGDGSTTTPAAGNWRYLKMADGATAQLDYVTVQYGGAYYAMVWADDNAASVEIDNSTLQYSSNYTAQIDPDSTVTITNSTISNTNSYAAVYITGGTATVQGNTISAASSYGVYSDDASPTIVENTIINSSVGIYFLGSTASPSITNNTFTGNTYPIYARALTSNTVLSGNTGSSNTYDVIMIYASTSGDVTLGSENDLPFVIQYLTVNTGDTLTVAPGTVLKLFSSSSYLIINGSLDSEGTLTDPIVFTSFKDDSYGDDTNNDGTATSAAAADWSYIQVSDSATATFDYATIQYGGHGGVMFLVDDDAANVSVNHSVIQNSGTYTVQIDSGSTATIANSTIASNVFYAAVYLTGGTTTLTDNTITASHGASGSYGVYIVNASPVLTGNTINTVANYGIYVAGGSPTISDNTVNDSMYGIYLTGSSTTPEIMNNTFTGNTYPIYLGAVNSDTSISGNIGSGNTYNVIVLSGTTTGDVTLAAESDFTYAPYRLTVNAGTTLTIEPGSVIKFLNSTSYLSVSGTLVAQGTISEPIIFTSINDDTVDGDTNNDGTATSAAAGDWAFISVADSATATFDYATIQYGGYVPAYGMLLAAYNATNVAVDHSTLQYSEFYTIQIDENSTISVSNSVIANTTGYVAAIYATGGTATITENTISSSGSYGIYIDNAAPTISENTIIDSSYGIYTTNGANPTLTNNRIFTNTSYGLYNNDSSVTVNAEQNWWGDVSGPYNAASNPSGTGNSVSDYVDFDPWLTADPDVDVTPPSDVALGAIRKDVWNHIITLNWTNPTDTDFDHIQIDRADVVAGTTTTLTSTATSTSYIDTTPSYSTTYTYTLYACDTSSNCSTGATTGNQRLRNPAPTNLVLTPGDTTITATWNASSASAATLGGYKVYYGTSPTALTTSIDVGNTTTATLTGLTNGTRYYVAVTAYSTTGVESDLSRIRAIRPRP